MFVRQFIYSIKALRYIIYYIHLHTGEITGTFLIIQFRHFHILFQLIGCKDGLVEREGETAVYLVAFQFLIILLWKRSPVILPIHFRAEGKITSGGQYIGKVQIPSHLQGTGGVINRQTVGLRDFRQPFRPWRRKEIEIKQRLELCLCVKIRIAGGIHVFLIIFHRITLTQCDTNRFIVSNHPGRFRFSMPCQSKSH